MTVNLQQLEEYTKLLEEIARRKRIEKFKSDILAFGQYYLKERIFTTETPQFHRDLVDAVQEALFDRQRGHFLAIAAPRSHAKSMIVTVTSTLWAIVNGYHYILIISAKQDIAKQLLQIIKNEILNNELLRQDYGDLYAKDVWNALEIVTSNGCKVQAAGAGDSLRGLNFNGYRPEIIICDDLERDPDVLSANYRDQMWQWLQSVCIPLGNPGKTHLLYIGTLLHPDSVLKRAMTQDPRFKALTFSAIKKFPSRMDLWDKFGEILHDRSVSDDGEEDSAYQAAIRARQFYLEHKQEMDEGAEVLWPSRMSLLDLMTIRYTQRRAFQTEYLQDPRDETTAIFTNFVYYDELPPLDECDIFGALDPSLGKSSRSDPSAIITIAKHRKTGIIYVVDVNMKRRSPDAIIEDVIRLAHIYDYKEFGIETVQYQEFLAQQIQQRSALAGIYLPIRPLKPTTDKVLRISSIEPLVSNGLIRFGKNHVTLVEQLQDFPHGNFDDGADCLEMCVSLAINKKRKQFVFDVI